jgi:autotransporter strand-loop-strand O-heptosyltransferase
MKILIILSHCSTGGMPQVALKRVENLISSHDVYVIEYREIAWSYIVQRNKLKSILGDRFISLGWIDKEETRDNFIKIVEYIDPDIIHMEEIPEKFIFGIRKEHVEWLYRKDRKYKIFETTHTSTFDVNQKVYFPDKFIFASKYSQQEYSKFNIPSSVIEYPVKNLKRNQSLSIRQLELDPDYFHVLNVGLFTRDKNQGYLFDIAEKLKKYKIQFHFVGNQAENFSDYWQPLIDRKLENCIIHGEKDNVDVFYQAADLLIHPSILELNPLAIKEATSYNLPILLNRLHTYLDMYDSYKNIKYLTMNLDSDIDYILKNFNIGKKSDNYSYQDHLISEYKSILDVKDDILLNDDNSEDVLDYSITFTDGARVEITGDRQMSFDVHIIDKETGSIFYNSALKTNNWCTTNIKYYKEYEVKLFYDNEVIVTHIFNAKDKNVLIQFDSSSIGDNLAWIPYVEEFRKKHDCKMYCSTFHNKWFIEEYPEITFIEPGSKVDNLYAQYNIGWYQPYDSNKVPNDYKKMPLQKTASDVLGLDYKEIRPKIKIAEGVRPIEEKYVCIAQFSTANSKHWHYPIKDSNKGWQILVDWLNAQGYKVMAISKQKTSLQNVIDLTGDFPIEHRINQLKYCEFFIGIGSGLSWLAWAIGKKVVMISGFSDPICEFQTNNINVHNFNVCNGCFNKFQFDRGDWNWCPEHKDTDRHFECTINITPKMITDRIVSAKLVENVKPFNFDSYNMNVVLDRNNITIKYERDINKFSIGYSVEKDTPKINVSFKDYHTNRNYHTISDISLSNKYIIWCVPQDVVYKETDKVIVSFYEKTKILDIEFNL